MRGHTTSINNGQDGQALPTSRTTPHGERAVLAILRTKAPHRALTPREAAQVAEWQATSLLELAGLTEPPTPAALIAELPRVLVHTDVDLPVSGCTSWSNGRWLIVLNGAEPYARQRFSLAHEFKHAIDHRHRDVMYVDRPGLSAAAQAEQAADYFAASLLMPRRWVQQAWSAGIQHLHGRSGLCRRFEVSPPAMALRLQHLGLGTAATDRDLPGRQSPTYARRSRPWVRSPL
jgi:Zn-dependent peptidase ImmA (M78 family)